MFSVELIDEVKYTNWDSNVFSRDGQCISVGTSDGKWKAIGCIGLMTVVCQRGNRLNFQFSIACKVDDIQISATLVKSRPIFYMLLIK